MNTHERVSVQLERGPEAPQRARAIVRDALSAAGHDDLVEVARLLTTELVTNAVVHAASPPELEIIVGADGVTVTVRDADTGPIVRHRPAGELVEGGRGIVLVDRLADAWGTEHSAGRKAVWFRLTANGAGAPDAAGDRRVEPAAPGVSAEKPTPRPGPAPGPDPATADRLHLADLLLRPRVSASLGFEEQVAEILERTMAAVGGTGATVTLTGREPRHFSRGAESGPTVATSDLVVAERTLGTLSVRAAHDPGPDGRAFIAFAAERLALLVAQEGIVRDERSRTHHLDYLAEVGDLLAGSLDVTLTLALAAQIAVPHLGEWCAAYRVDDHARVVRSALAHVREDDADEVAAALDTDPQVQTAVHDAVGAHGPTRSLRTGPTTGGSTVTLAPLVSRGRTVGLLVLGTAAPPDAAARMMISEVARRVAVAVDNAALNDRQAATAAALQGSLLPRPLPDDADFELAARYHAASPGLMVGGDFYDAFAMPDGAMALILGDVCGKGAEAAALTGISRDALRLLIQIGYGPAEALRMLNRLLLERNTDGRFCTAAVAVLRREPERTRVRLCLAGHPEPVVLHADGSTDLVGLPGQLLGVLPDSDLVLHEVELDLACDDALVLYTDGVTERREGERMFGTAGLLTALADVAGTAAPAIASHLEETARAFVPSELRDDIAILVVRRRPGPEQAAARAALRS